MPKTAKRVDLKLYGNRFPSRTGFGASGQPNRLAEAPSFTSTQAKNKFGHVLERAIRGDVIVITKHDTAKAVLMSMEDFNALSAATRINTLTAEFDRMLEQMQSPKAKKAVKALFQATPKELGRAALQGARKRN